MVPLETWRRRGRDVTTRDGRVFVVDVPARPTPPGDAGERAPLVILHGFPTASWDFADVIERLSSASGRRIVTFDFLGYGFSEKPRDHAYSLFQQADLALEVLRDCGITRAHLLAHDMGTSVATELCARRERGLLPFELASLVLTNGSVHIELAQLTLGQRILRTPLGPVFARLNNRKSFGAQISKLYVRRPSEAELDAMWTLVSREGGAALLPALIGYVSERWRFRRRWIGALERLDVPTLIAWGERDPVAVLAIATALAREIPGAKLETWSDLAHWPMVEDPVRFASTVGRFLDGLPEMDRRPGPTVG